MQLVAKVRDVHVDCARNQAARIEMPNLLENFIARDRAVRVRGEIPQEIGLPAGEFISIAVIVPDFGTLQVCHPTRELYQAHTVGC
jgi:hypothetical protein